MGADPIEVAIRTPGAHTAAHFQKRVTWLAIVHGVLAVAALVGEILIVWKARFFVILAQRSNVETLVIGFFMLFFIYVGYLAARGVPGALRLTIYGLRRLAGADPIAIEKAKFAALGPPVGSRPVCALNVIVERKGRRGEPVEIPVADEAGSLGKVRLQGARMGHVTTCKDGSTHLLAYVADHLDRVADKGDTDEITIVEWRRIDEEETEKYLSLVDFAGRLGKKLGEDLWPTVTLDDDAIATLEREITKICPAIRSSSFLPHWEYAAELKLPVVPEPLGLISLSRSEKRVDPLASMGTLAVIVILVDILVAYFIWRPPWVPGA